MLRSAFLLTLLTTIALSQTPPSFAQDASGLAAYTVTESRQPVALDPVIAALLEIGKGNAVAVNPMTGEPMAPVQVQEIAAPDTDKLGG
ncbi:MAG: hypothetical protein GC199_01695 [Alphaproteobacteria bacterium]|nr:hypothetical protein [Alphaproteobacteria bacterium]